MMIRLWNMRWAEHMACMEENEMHLGYQWEKSKEKNNNHLENLRIDWRMILKLTLQKQFGMVWIGFIWLGSGRSLFHGVDQQKIYATKSGRRVPTFRQNVLMKETCSTEMLLHIYRTIWHHIPDGSHYCEKSGLILHLINCRTQKTGKHQHLQNCPEEFYHVHVCSAKPHSYQVHYCFKYNFSHYTCSSCNNYPINLLSSCDTDLQSKKTKSTHRSNFSLSWALSSGGSYNISAPGSLGSCRDCRHLLRAMPRNRPPSTPLQFGIGTLKGFDNSCLMSASCNARMCSETFSNPLLLYMYKSISHHI